MMTARNAFILSVAFVAAVSTGCGSSAPSRFYTLESTAVPEGSSSASYAISVGPVTVPGAVDRPQFVVQVAPNRVEIEEFNRWASPLDESIERVVAGNLSVLLGTPRVATSPLANFDPAYRVTIDVQRFDSIAGKSALIEAVWTVRPLAGGDKHSGRTIAHEPVQAEGLDGLAAAHSRALKQVSRDIAAAIRAAEEQKP